MNGHNTGIPTEFLIQVRGGDSHNTRAVQVERRAAALNSNDVFVLPAGATTYVWCGKGSTGIHRTIRKIRSGLQLVPPMGEDIHRVRLTGKVESKSIYSRIIFSVCV